MAERCETMRIASTHPESQGPFVEINIEDFDAAVHTPWTEDPYPGLSPAQEAALDGDGDKKPGSSLKGARRKKA